MNWIYGQKHKVFISFYHQDDQKYKNYIRLVFIKKYY